MLYNTQQKIRNKALGGRTPIQALIDELTTKGYVHNVKLCDGNHVTHLFVAHPKAIQLVREYHRVLLMDCTYKTNAFNMPLLNIVGVTSLSTTFTVGYVLLPQEQESDYSWALRCLRDAIQVTPGVVLTDCELALLRANNEVFPTTPNYICIWHINKNVTLHCKSGLSEEQWNEFLKGWTGVCLSQTEADFDSNWDAFSAKHGVDTRQVNYLLTTWLPHKQRFVAAWTNKDRHLDNTATSRVEGAHAALKNQILTRNIDLLKLFQGMYRLWETQLHEFETKIGYQQMSRLPRFDPPLWRHVTCRISRYALGRVYDFQYGKAIASMRLNGTPLT